MIKITDPKACCGCTACASICHHDAITMAPDALGFLYPQVDESKCVSCGLCDKVCAFNEHYDKSLNLDVPLAYGVRHRDTTELPKSRSGAAFVAFSDYILEQGGVVYGAGYANHFRVVHKRATDKTERDEFRCSKYVQSDLRGVFRCVKDDLKQGKLVLFSGTPCQTAGLNSYVGGKLRARLFLVDIICHAAPSPSIWRDYLEYVERKYRRTAVAVEFREKEFGWSAAHKERFYWADGTHISLFTFRYLFYQSLTTRYSCHDCKYCNYERPSDLTIGDFWGIEKVNASFNADNKGVSVVLVNTAKGKDLFDRSAAHLNYFQVTPEQAYQPNLAHPTPASPLRERFERDYERHGFEYVARRYGNIGYRYQVKTLCNKIKRKLHIR